MAAARTNRWSNAAFAVVFLVTLVFLYEVVAPFVIPVLVGAFVVVLFSPVHERLVRLLGGRRRLASVLSSISVLLLLLLPAAGLGILLVQQVQLVLERLREALGPTGMEELLGGRLPGELLAVVEGMGGLGIVHHLERLVDAGAGWFAGMAAGVVGATTGLVIDAFLVVVSLYYFFLDGPRLLSEAAQLSPLETRYELEFFREFRDVAHTMIYVNLVTSLIQGVAGGIGFWVVGLPQPLAWAALMALLSLVPIVGTGLVWVPAGLWLVLAGQGWQGAFLLGWGLLVIGPLDNVLRPLLAKGRIRLHPLLIFVTIFGGLTAFGPVGVIIGPLVGAIFTAMVRIWKRDFVPRLAAAAAAMPGDPPEAPVEATLAAGAPAEPPPLQQRAE